MFLHGRAFLAGGYLSLAVSFFTFQNLAAQNLQPITGRMLFEREWQISDPLCPNGDGLGPCFNAASCVACHHQGGAGGGGDLVQNVDLLTLRTPPEDVKRIFEKANRKPLKLHPSFLEGQMTIILHASGVYLRLRNFPPRIARGYAPARHVSSAEGEVLGERREA